MTISHFNLKWHHVLALYLIGQGHRVSGKDILYSRDGNSLFNEFLKSEGVSIRYTHPITSNNQRGRIISVLKENNLIQGPDGKKHWFWYDITDKGRDVLQQVGDDWRQWPLDKEYTHER